MSGQRARWSGTGESLAAALREFATTPVFIVYEESDNIRGVNVDATAILKHKPLLRKLNDLGALHITKKVALEAITIVAAHQCPKWHMTPEQTNDWISSMVKRLRNITSAFANAQKKNAKWLEKFHDQPMASAAVAGSGPSAPAQPSAPPLASAAGAGSGPAAPAQPSAPPPASAAVAGSGPAAPAQPTAPSPASAAGGPVAPSNNFLYGWKKELGLAYRVPEGRPISEAELSLPIVITADDPDEQQLIAHWADNDMWSVSAWTVGRYRAAVSRAAAPRSSDTGKLWVGQQVDTGHSLHIAQRVDRKLLLSLFEQGRQVLQLDVERFGALPQPQPMAVPKNHPALVAALAFLQPIGELYAHRELVDAAALKKYRDEELKRQNITRVVRRRPAAAATMAPIEVPDDTQDDSARVPASAAAAEAPPAAGLLPAAEQAEASAPAAAGEPAADEAPAAAEAEAPSRKKRRTQAKKVAKQPAHVPAAAPAHVLAAAPAAGLSPAAGQAEASAPAAGASAAAAEAPATSATENPHFRPHPWLSVPMQAELPPPTPPQYNISDEMEDLLASDFFETIEIDDADLYEDLD